MSSNNKDFSEFLSNNSGRNKKVYQYDINGNFIKE
jgi:hypothetical protein